MKKKTTSLALNKKLVSKLNNKANSLMGGTGTMGPHPNPPTWQETEWISCIPDEPDPKTMGYGCNSAKRYLTICIDDGGTF